MLELDQQENCKDVCLEKQTLRCDEFDFEAMATLARNAPLEFARRRAQLIDQAISSYVDPEKGKAAQAEIERYITDVSEGQDTYVAILTKGLGSLVGQVSDCLATMTSNR